MSEIAITLGVASMSAAYGTALVCVIKAALDRYGDTRIYYAIVAMLMIGTPLLIAGLTLQ